MAFLGCDLSYDAGFLQGALFEELLILLNHYYLILSSRWWFGQGNRGNCSWCLSLVFLAYLAATDHGFFNALSFVLWRLADSVKHHFNLIFRKDRICTKRRYLLCLPELWVSLDFLNRLSWFDCLNLVVITPSCRSVWLIWWVGSLAIDVFKLFRTNNIACLDLRREELSFLHLESFDHLVGSWPREHVLVDCHFRNVLLLRILKAYTAAQFLNCVRC